MAKKNPATKAAARNPGRTRSRILAAALHEFAAHGFAGARVDEVAQRAKVNKRMLYHYFSDKDGLFRAVLRDKIAERAAKVGAATRGKKDYSGAAVWFQQNCADADWVRLLAWESLHADADRVIDERERRHAVLAAIAALRHDQSAGRLRPDVDAAFMLLAKISLSMFPFALPQAARLITGRSPHDKKFQRDYAHFLETIADGFRPTVKTGRPAR
jgi:AcrR family transcriptional regulator